MTTSICLSIALPTPLRKLFHYLPPPGCNLKNLQPGIRVRVPFQKRELIGILMATCSKPDVPWDKLKPAIEFIDQESVFNEDIWQLCLWAAEYYQYSIGEVFMGALPLLLRQGKTIELKTEKYWGLSDLGRKTTSLRSPKQLELLTLLSNHSEGLSIKELNNRGFSRAVLKAAEKKDLVTCLSTPALPPCQPAEEKSLNLNEDQQHALNEVLSAKDFQIFLLDGITGSGKTEVYLQAIASILEKGLQILVLVPEIGLTPQTIQRFRRRFSVPVVALHSGLTEKERLNAWVFAKSGQAKIIIGTRSAIFTPFKKLGLIVVDEEHDLSFKQQDGFRYHARDLAIMRARTHQISIILGSATPSLETLYNAQSKRFHHLKLHQRAGNAVLPQFQLLDIRNLPMQEGLSLPLITEIKEHLQQGNQAMIFLNRRGFAPVLMCHACGWMAICKRCDMRMTYHLSPSYLHCHHCDTRKPVPHVCEKCREKELQRVGLGTERIEECLKKYFQEYSIARIDRDSTQRKGSLEDMLEKIHQGEHQILIGTQMLAKGHHFPNVTLVAIIDADGGFFSSDFRALERMGQLVLQVAGRAGRMEKPGKVIIQTHHPDHPLLQQLIYSNYHQFALSLLNERKNAEFPPFSYFALFRAEAYQSDHALEFLTQVRTLCAPKTIQIMGPILAPMPRRAGRYRAQLLIHSPRRPHLQEILKQLIPQIDAISGKHKVRWSLDVDPVDMS